tara:strand:+ start:684 stop:1442 length:759 start_codon:yes stop_codon:yes gene_type:complete
MTGTSPKTTGPIRLSLIIPAYNEAGRIEKTLRLVLRYLDDADYSAEVIVVDDGSTDATAGVIRAFRTAYTTPLRLHQLPKNKGKGAAVKAGMLEVAYGEVRVFFDADASTPIEELEKIWEPLASGAQVVIGSRSLPDSQVEIHQAKYRETMGRTYNRILRVLGLTSFIDTQCGFKAFTAEATELLFRRQTLDGFSFDVELLYIATKHGLPITEIPVVWRNNEASRVNPVTDSFHMFWDLLRIKYRNWNHVYD